MIVRCRCLLAYPWLSIARPGAADKATKTPATDNILNTGTHPSSFCPVKSVLEIRFPENNKQRWVMPEKYLHQVIDGNSSGTWLHCSLMS